MKRLKIIPIAFLIICLFADCSQNIGLSAAEDVLSRTIVALEGANDKSVTVTIPDDAGQGETIRIILEVGDNGEPALTSFRWVIVILVPNK